MKKIHNLKLFGLVAFLAFALVFIGIDSIEGQVRTTSDGLEQKKLEDFEIMPIFHRYPVSDPKISPDGTRVLFTYATTNMAEDRYDTHIWSIALDEGTPKQFTYGKGDDIHPRWSQDGKSILFLSSRLDGKTNTVGAGTVSEGTYQIFVMPADGGEAISITALEEGVQRPSWSPDGKTILFSSPVPQNESADGSDVDIIRRINYKIYTGGYVRGRRTHIFSVPASGGEIKQLTDGEFDVDSPVWSPDGDRVAFISNLEDPADLSGLNHLYTVPSNGGDPELLWENARVSGPMALGWSPDGKYLAFSGRAIERPRLLAHRNRDVWALPVEGGEPKNLTANLDRSEAWHRQLYERIWSPDSKHVYFKIDDLGAKRILRVSLDGEVEYMTEEKKNVGRFGFSLDRTGSKLAFTSSDLVTPFELWINDEKGTRRLTYLHEELLSTLRVNKPEEFWFTASDGAKVHGWIIKPRGFEEGKKYRTILEIHGGPGFTSYGFMFAATEHEFQTLADHGYVVFYTNPRGSTGYGAAFSNTSGRHGERDFQDIMESVDFVAENYPFADVKRMGVTGGSFGGFMTNWVIGHSDRFKAAVSLRGVWEGLPEVENMNTPLLHMHADLDFISPVAKAETLFVALKRQKKVVEFVRFPNENHDLSRIGRPKHRVERLRHMLRWFDRYVR